MTTNRTLDVPGARVHYEVRGDGPLVLVMGSPMDAASFAGLADALATDHTVVTHDPRGISNSTIDDPAQDSTPELRADDVAALLDALGADTADVFGSSGAAVTGLALLQRHPGRVRTLVAHEPPLLELLDDAAEQRAGTERIIEAFHDHGVGAAWGVFMANAGFDLDEGAGPPPSDDPGRDAANGERFFAHELRWTTRYVPNVDALRSSTSRIVVGVGADSGPLVTARTSAALAALLGVEPTVFVGDHGGFLFQPEEFADQLRKALVG